MKGVSSMDAEDAKAKRKAEGERYSRIMWAYVCGAIALVSVMVGFGRTFIPLGFAIFGGILAWQLNQAGEQRHGGIAGALALGGLLIWLTYNWPTIQRYIGG
jgi:hypothetical protein